jgi:hypothetical protein
MVSHMRATVDRVLHGDVGSVTQLLSSSDRVVYQLRVGLRCISLLSWRLTPTPDYVDVAINRFSTLDVIC